MDPCERLTDEDIVYALRNSSGLRNVLFVPEVSTMVISCYTCSLSLSPINFPFIEISGYYKDVFIGFQVPFEVLVRRQIAQFVRPLSSMSTDCL